MQCKLDIIIYIDHTCGVVQSSIPNSAPHDSLRSRSRDTPLALPRLCLRYRQVISMGEGGSGKTCLIKRYCEQRVWHPPHLPRH